MANGKPGVSMGPSTDRLNVPVVDPTENVKALTEAANLRQDDLRIETTRRFEQDVSNLKERLDESLAHLKELSVIRAEHQKELNEKESSRLDSIRQVDREEVAKTAAAANTAITTLATQTITLKDTLASQVANTAALAETRLANFSTDVTKRLSALELSSSEGRGKQLVGDPALAQLATSVEGLLRSQGVSTGKSQGISMAWAVLIGAVALAGAVVGLISKLP